MSRRGWIIAGAVIFTLFTVGTSCQTFRWVGRFPSQEFEITFLDSEGNPVPGVELRVETPTGDPIHGYPVTDYVPGGIPRSDERGIMMFHHKSHGPEFGGECSDLWGFIPIGTCEAPKYTCRFLLDGAEVYRVPYSELRRDDPGILVERAWKVPAWPGEEYLEIISRAGVEELDLDTLEKRWFDANGDGEWSREEAVARRAVYINMEEYLDTVHNPDREPEIVRFSLINKTVIIQQAR